jgi:DNA-binding winged helix-turn-helix (wHTH) protein
VNSKRQDLRLDDPYPTCEFGEFRLDVRHRSLSRAGEPLPATARALDTLICLVRHRGTLLSREALMDLVWPQSDVEPNNLSQTIKKLRRLLGEKPGENRFIETVPGRGYRFIADLRVSAGTWGGAESADAMPTLLTRSGVAVVLIEWCAQLDLLDLAFQLGRRALDSFAAVRPPSWQSLWAPELLPLRRDARFGGLVDQLGFASYWNAHGPPDCAAVRPALRL